MHQWTIFNICSDNGWLFKRYHCLNQCWHIVNWIHGKKLRSHFNQNTYVFIQENAFEMQNVGHFVTGPMSQKRHYLGNSFSILGYQWFCIYSKWSDNLIKNIGRNLRDLAGTWICQLTEDVWAIRTEMNQWMESLYLQCQVFTLTNANLPSISLWRISVKTLIKIIFTDTKCIWKCLLQNGSHFVEASMC